MAKLRVTLVKSTNGCLQKQKATVVALGLRKIRSTEIGRASCRERV